MKLWFISANGCEEGIEQTVLVDLLARIRRELRKEVLVGETAMPLSKVVAVASEAGYVSFEDMLGREGVDCASDTATEVMEAEGWKCPRTLGRHFVAEDESLMGCRLGVEGATGPVKVDERLVDRLCFFCCGVVDAEADGWSSELERGVRGNNEKRARARETPSVWVEEEDGPV